MSAPEATVDAAVPAVLAPVAAGERFVALDAVRGFALLGIFLMNAEFFARPMQDINAPGIDPALSGLDWAADAAIFFFVQSKFWTLFSLLFGMGFAVMIERARRAGRPFVPAYLRRSLALLGIGLVHALLVWSGDILVTYAIAALVLLAGRGAWHGAYRLFAGEAPPPVAPRVLALLGVASYSLMLVFMLAFGIGQTFTPATQAAASAQDLEERRERREEHEVVRERAAYVYAAGTYREAVAQRRIDTEEQLDALGGFLPFVLGVFLIGMAILRTGVLERPEAFGPQLRTTRNAGFVLGFAMMAGSTALGTGMDFERFDLGDATQVVLYLLAGLVLAIAYGATVVQALAGRAGPWLRRWLAPAGQMALTNYLAQSVFGTLVFYGYGLGGWGRIGRFEGVLLVLTFYALQLAWSRAWLAHFRFGPAEWLWRALTYVQLPPMRREPAVVA